MLSAIPEQGRVVVGWDGGDDTPQTLTRNTKKLNGKEEQHSIVPSFPVFDTPGAGTHTYVAVRGKEAFSTLITIDDDTSYTYKVEDIVKISRGLLNDNKTDGSGKARDVVYPDQYFLDAYAAAMSEARRTRMHMFEGVSDKTSYSAPKMTDPFPLAFRFAQEIGSMTANRVVARQDEVKQMQQLQNIAIATEEQ